MTQTDPRIACESAPSAATLEQPKSVLRKHLLAARQALPDAQRSAACLMMSEHLLSWQAATGLISLAVYWPIRDEPDLMPAYRQLVQRGVQLALPIVRSADAALDFAAWVPGQAMAQDVFGVAIPAGEPQLFTPAALLIPCVGINPQCYRLGYGGGMYDRTLAQWPDAITVGIAFDCARASFASETHDIRLRHLITESGIEAVS